MIQDILGRFSLGLLALILLGSVAVAVEAGWGLPLVIGLGICYALGCLLEVWL